jgi:diguanylate cyclase (GGDEF)-like protein/PAS domain S-box-containing protein
VLFGGVSLYLFLGSLKVVREQEQQMSLISSNIADGIYVIDKLGRITFANQRASELLGYTNEEFLGAVAHDLFHRHQSEQGIPLKECPIFMVIQTFQRYNGEELFAHKDGRLMTVMVASQPMLKGDKVIGSVTVFHDISEQKLMEERLRVLSVTDPLTGIYNRRFLQEMLLKAMSRADRHEGAVCLIMFDLDHFKLLNDRYGHDVGDSVLLHVVGIVKARIRASDCFARWGGEEFLLLLPDTKLAAASVVAETLLEALRSSAVEGVGCVTASFGVACYRSGDTAQLFVQRADALMYDAKQTGRNCVKTEELQGEW